MESSWDDQQRLLLQALEQRFATVQLLHRSAAGEWTVRHERGSQAREGLPAVLVDADVVRLLDWIHPDDRLRIARSLSGVCATSTPWSGRVRLSATGSHERWADIAVECWPAAAQGALLFVTALDVTPQKSVEDRFQQLADHWSLVSVASGLGTLSFDVPHGRMSLDAAACAQHGLLATPSMTLDDWLALFIDEDRPAARAMLSIDPTALQAAPHALRLHGRTGSSTRTLQASFRASADRRRFVGACRDVTEERSLEDMRRKKLAAERANKSKSEFMSHVSHELRTPLNGILGFAQLMQMDQTLPLPPEQAKRLEILLYSARRLLGLIDKLLEISKIERGAQTLRLRPLDVASIVQLCVDQVRPLADEQGIGIGMEIDVRESPVVRADAGALEQVLVNLLSNAVKYNRPNGRVRVVFLVGEAGTGTIMVDDTGRGMSESELARLFEPFNRLSAETSDVPGHGLGLVISKQLIEAMHGELSVQSKEGVGSRFAVKLPLAEEAADDTPTTLPLDLPSQWDTGGQYNVLYIEDDEVNTVLMEQVFTTQPEWRLVTAPNGSEGIAIAVRERPDLILIDLNLPDMPGQDVFKYLRQDARTRHIPCVVVSADALPAHVRKVMATGFDDYWTKPLELTTIIARLKVLLRRQ